MHLQIFEEAINIIAISQKFELVDNFFDWIFNVKSIIQDENIHSSLIQENIYDQLVVKSIQKGEQYWFIQRKVINSLFELLNHFPTYIKYFQDSIQQILRITESRSYANSLAFYQYEYRIECINSFKQKQKPQTDYFGNYPKFMLLSFFDKQIQNIKLEANQENLTNQKKQYISELIQQIFNLSLLLFEFSKNKKLKIDGNFEHSEIFDLYLNNWHSLCVLNQIIDKNLEQNCKKHEIDIDFNQYLDKIFDNLEIIFEINAGIFIRQYQQIYLIRVIQQFPQYHQHLLKIISNKNIKINTSIPTLFVAGFIMSVTDNQEMSQEFFKQLFAYQMSPVAFLRIISQYFIYKYLEKFPYLLENFAISNVYDHLKDNKEYKKMIKKFSIIVHDYEQILQNFSIQDLLSTDFDNFGRVVNGSVINDLKDAADELFNQFYIENPRPIKNADKWLNQANIIQQEHEMQITKEQQKATEITNFQLKYAELDNKLTEAKREIEKENRSKEIIIIASLLDRIPNFGHLTRTCEIFKAGGLVLPNRNILEDPEFKKISVTGEKWLPIYEFKPQDLLGYLLLQKKKGYHLIGLEQASKSYQLQEYQFPDKCLLLLGNEAKGMPNEYFNILDSIIEIPQFGKLGSLNVHVSGILSLWEYTKQKIVEKKQIK